MFCNVVIFLLPLSFTVLRLHKLARLTVAVLLMKTIVNMYNIIND